MQDISMHSNIPPRHDRPEVQVGVTGGEIKHRLLDISMHIISLPGRDRSQINVGKAGGEV